MDALDCRLDQLAHERRRRVGGRASSFGFHRRDDRGFERRLVLFEIERDLVVADATHQRADQEPAGKGQGGDDERDPESEDGRRAEAKRFERIGRGHQRDGGRRDEAHRAPQRELAAPALTHLTDDVDERRTGIA
jgi:hypothetical protein